LLGRIDHTSHVLVREGGREGGKERWVVRERGWSEGRELIEKMRRRRGEEEEEEKRRREGRRKKRRGRVVDEEEEEEEEGVQQQL